MATWDDTSNILAISSVAVENILLVKEDIMVVHANMIAVATL